MLFLGTSGWNYAHWNGRFYPAGLAPREQLTFLARYFGSVELNASFYRLPPAANFAKWYKDTPPEFRFSVKVPRTITHVKRLAGVEDDWLALVRASEPLGEKLSVYLCQFPPSFRATPGNIGRMEAFLELVMVGSVRVAFELRHSSWFEAAGLGVFARQAACVVRADSSRFPHTPESFASGEFNYYRFHGPRQLYASQYTDEELEHWAGLMAADLAAGKDVYGYFDNDEHGYALADAQRIRDLLPE